MQPRAWDILLQILCCGKKFLAEADRAFSRDTDGSQIICISFDLISPSSHQPSSFSVRSAHEQRKGVEQRHRVVEDFAADPARGEEQ
ncbi:hypothetical protein EON65_45190, partial [archaeon]